MAKISTYPPVGTPTLSDMLIGTDASDSNATKNFTISSIVALANLGQFVPYTGATADVNLGTYALKTDTIQASTASNSIETLDNTGNGAGLLIDNNNGLYKLGDYNSIYTGTYISIDDNFGRIILQGSLYVNGSSGSTGQFLMSNGISGVPSWSTPPAASLNAVLTAGNTSALDAKIGSLFLKDGSAFTYSKISSSVSGAISFISPSSNSFFVVDSTQLTFGAFARFDNSLLTAQRSYDLPDNSGTIPLSVNGVTPDNTTGDITLPASSGTAKTVKVSLSSAQILALDTTPVTVVAGVAGKIIMPIKIYWRYTYGTIAYTGANMNLIYNASLWSTSIANTIIHTASNNGNIMATIATANLNLNVPDGADIKINAISPITAGDGTMDVYFTYDIVDA